MMFPAYSSWKICVHYSNVYNTCCAAFFFGAVFSYIITFFEHLQLMRDIISFSYNVISFSVIPIYTANNDRTVVLYHVHVSVKCGTNAIPQRQQYLTITNSKNLKF